MKKNIFTIALIFAVLQSNSLVSFIDDLNYPLRDSLDEIGKWNIGEVGLSNSYNQSNGLYLSSLGIDDIRSAASQRLIGLPSALQTSSQIPKGFYLGQSFANTFNPVTNFYFSIPDSRNIKITILDVLGKEVAAIVDDELSAGTYKAEFDVSSLSSGIYFYKLDAGDHFEIKKMTLVK